MKRLVSFLVVTIFALFFTEVRAQITLLDTVTVINGWKLRAYAEGVHRAATYFDNTSAYHGKYSQWFVVEQLREGATSPEKYWAIFEKKLPKPVKVYNNNTNPIGSGIAWYNYFHTKPFVSGYVEYINFDFSFGWKGVFTDYIPAGSNYYDGAWRAAPFNAPALDSIDCIRIRLSGDFKNTYVQVDYICFDKGDLGDPLSIIDDFEDSTIVDVEEQIELPKSYVLSQNYPNPFNPETSISYQISVSGHVTLKVFDLLGREVVALVDEEKSIGKHTVKFNASNLASGTYFYQLSVDRNKFTQVKKMLLVK